VRRAIVDGAAMIVFSRSNDLGIEMEALNRHLDKLVRPEVHMLRGARPAFQVCGYTGLALAVILTLILAPYLGSYSRRC
jgi:hypothetical protein